MVEGDVIPDLLAPGPARTRRTRRRLWMLLAIAVLVISGAVTLTTVSLHYADATAIRCTCGSGWLSLADAEKAAGSHADGHTQTTVPVRLGQQQGFMFQVVNPSSVTQTIIGLPGDFFFGVVRGPTALRASASTNRDIDPRAAAYVDHATLAPGQTRWLQLVWQNPPACISDGASSANGVTTSIDAVPIRVRVGAFTRTETIDLGTAIGLLTTGC